MAVYTEAAVAIVEAVVEEVLRAVMYEMLQAVVIKAQSRVAGIVWEIMEIIVVVVVVV